MPEIGVGSPGAHLLGRGALGDRDVHRYEDGRPGAEDGHVDRGAVVQSGYGHASALPVWTDTGTNLAADLAGWAERLFERYLAHPWLTQITWAYASRGPNEQDWLERLLVVLDRRDTPGTSRAAVVTPLYATVRAGAQTAAVYRGLARSDGGQQWLRRARATRRLIDDYARRYPLSLGLEPHEAHDWQDAPRGSIRSVVEVISRGLRSS